VIEALHDQYVCTFPVYKKGRLYKPGDVLLIPKGEPYTSKNFEPLCVSAPLVEQALMEEKSKSKKLKEVPEEGV
jgi:hypothetical protein